MSLSAILSTAVGAISPAFRTLSYLNTALGLLEGPQQGRSKISDLQVSGSQYGAPIPIYFGDQGVRLPVNFVWMDRPRVYDTSDTGAKGGGGQQWVKVSMLGIVGMQNPFNPEPRTLFGDKVILYSKGGGRNKRIDPDNVRQQPGGLSQSPDSLLASVLGADTMAYRWVDTLMLEDLKLRKWGNRIPNIEGIFVTDTVTLEDALTYLYGLVGLTDIDFSAGTDTIGGFVIVSDLTINEAANLLLKAYPYDLVEIDGTLTLKKRGSDPVLTIDENDLGAVAGEKKGAHQRVERRQKPIEELPKQVQLTYSNIVSNLQKSMVTATLEACDSKGIESVDLSAHSLTPAQATSLVHRVLYTKWLERDEYRFSLPWGTPSHAYARLAPGDVVLLPYEGSLVRVRIESMTVGLFAELEIIAVPDSKHVLEFNVIASGGATDAPHPVDGSAATTAAFWSGVELTDLDALVPGFYGVFNGQADGLPRNVRYRKSGDTQWITASNAMEREGVFGAAISSLSSASGWDLSNDFDLVLERGSLASVDPSAIPPSNLCLLGNELLGISTFTLTAPFTYTASDLFRGYRSSPTGGHTSSDSFVLLDSAVTRFPVSSSLIGETLEVQAWTDDDDPDDEPVYEVTIAAPGGATPVAPGSVSVSSAPNPGGSSLLLTATGVFSSSTPLTGQHLEWQYSTNSGSTWLPSTPVAQSVYNYTLSSGAVRFRARAVYSSAAATYVSSWTTSTDTTYSAPTVNPSGTAGGDLSGSYPNPTVAKIQGRSIATTSPSDGQALVWDNTASNWKPSSFLGSAGTPAAEQFNGNGSTTAFTLAHTPAAGSPVLVFVDGCLQIVTTNYSISGTTLTFTTAPPTGTSNVDVRYSY